MNTLTLKKSVNFHILFFFQIANFPNVNFIGENYHSNSADDSGWFCLLDFVSKKLADLARRDI